jgi:hypothetical protein
MTRSAAHVSEHLEIAIINSTIPYQQRSVNVEQSRQAMSHRLLLREAKSMDILNRFHPTFGVSFGRVLHYVVKQFGKGFKLQTMQVVNFASCRDKFTAPASRHRQRG